jgi:glycosyltransferase involved in cell wall biosynthesis
MVPTESLRRELQQVGFQNLRVVSRGVDTRLFSPTKRDVQLRRSWGATDVTPVALYVGRLASEKNLRTLVAAYEAMRVVRPEIKLVLVGDGPARQELETQIPGVVFAGLQRGEDLARHYASGDIFLFPSITETFGNVTPEAMASGLSVLAYDYAAASQLIRQGESGYLVPYNNTDAFVTSAATIARDWPNAKAIGMAARIVAESLDWERLVSDLEAVFHQAAQTSPAPREILVPHAGNASA